MFSPLPWFGPRGGLNWGWTPITWEGGAICLFFVGAIALAFRRYGDTAKFFCALVLLTLGLVALGALTGTSPG